MVDVDRYRCCECHEPAGGTSVLVCADCGGRFHYPDARTREAGKVCGTHLVGLRAVVGADVVPLCLRCDMAIRLRLGIPS